MFKRGDIILIAFFAAAALCFHIYSLTRREGAAIEIYSDGGFYGEFSLYENREIEVVNQAGNVNVIEIRDGYAHISYADCPDEICVRQGNVSKEGAAVVCVPNKLSMRIVSSELDGVTQ